MEKVDGSNPFTRSRKTTLASQPQSVTATALLIGVAGFVLGTLMVVILGMPSESADGPGVTTGERPATISNDAATFQQPAGNLQGSGAPASAPSLQQGSTGLQGGAPMTEQQARQLLQ